MNAFLQYAVCPTHHTFVPDDGHPLLCAVGSLRDEGEVVLPHGSLRGVEGAVGAACHLEVATVDTQTWRNLSQYANVLFFFLPNLVVDASRSALPSHTPTTNQGKV